LSDFFHATEYIAKLAQARYPSETPRPSARPGNTQTSGVRWKDEGAKILLSLRAPTNTAGRGAQFWQKIDQFEAECVG
jgi:hypothetical protein